MKGRYVVIFLLFFSHTPKAQILFVNPNMAGSTCTIWGGCIADDWTKCWLHEYTALVESGQPLGIPKYAYEGTTFADIGAFSPNSFGTMSQRLNCYIKKKCEYEFSFAGASYFEDMADLAVGRMQVFFNHDTCSENQLAYTSPYLDTMWGVYTARFTANDDYEWIQFRPLYEGTGMQLFLDALSPILCLNAHEVSITGTKDTTVPASNPCVQLSAQTNLSTYDSLYWIKLPNDTFAYNQWNTTVCPDTDAVYVVAIHDSSNTCAGTWWSFDTVRVRVDESNSSPTLSKAERRIQIYPNPVNSNAELIVLSSESGEVTLTDNLGRIITKSMVNHGYTKIGLKEYNLPTGIYYYQYRMVESDRVETGKLIIAE